MEITKEILSRENKSCHKVLFSGRIVEPLQLMECSLYSLMNETKSSLAKISKIYPAKLPIAGYVVGSCNGLVCILNQVDVEFHLWNPYTRMSFQLPEMETKFSRATSGLDWDEIKAQCVAGPCGFGWDETSGAYKVFVIMIRSNYWRTHVIKVYSSKTNEWTTKEEIRIGGSLARGPFLNGKLHWHRHANDGGSNAIVSFDLKSEVLGIVKLPSNYECIGEDCNRVSLGALRGLLCVSHDLNEKINVWIMKEYGVTESWIKVMEVSLSRIYKNSMVRPNKKWKSPVSVIDEGPNGEILIIHQSLFLVYDPKHESVLQTKKMKCSRYGGYGFDVNVCFEASLVSPIPEQTRKNSSS